MTDAPGLDGRQLLADVLSDLLTELDHGTVWDNNDLPSFLEALSALLGSIENSYVNRGEPVPSDPWKIMSRAFRGARYYE